MDPDGGSIFNAIEVTCQKEMLRTCVTPKQQRFETRSYVSQASSEPAYVAKLMGTTRVSYSNVRLCYFESRDETLGEAIGEALGEALSSA